MSKKSKKDQGLPFDPDNYTDAFFVTGQIGYLLLHNEMEHLRNGYEEPSEDPRLR